MKTFTGLGLFVFSIMPASGALWLPGCVGLVPFEEILRTVPENEFVRIQDRWVHMERRGEGPTVVLVHGFGGSTFSWRDVLSPLAESFDVIAVDLNGFGYTERPQRSDDYSPSGQTELIRRVMDELEIERAHLVGHSYGAGIVLLYASTHPERTNSLVLVDGGSFGSGSRGPGISPVLAPIISCLVKVLFLNEDRIREFLEGAVFDPTVVTSEMVAGYLHRLRIEGFDDAIRGLSSGGGGSTSSIEPTSIAQPTLIVWGIHDRVIPMSVGESLDGQIPNSELIRFENSGHLPMEEEPEKFVLTLRTFLGGP